MAANFENMGHEVISKTIPRIEIATKRDLRVSEALPPIYEWKMATDFENMGYEAVPKTISRIKMAAKPD